MNNKTAQAIRTASGLTQGSVAAHIGVKQSQLSHFERYGVPLPKQASMRLTRLLKKYESALDEIVRTEPQEGRA